MLAIGIALYGTVPCSADPLPTPGPGTATLLSPPTPVNPVQYNAASGGVIRAGENNSNFYKSYSDLYNLISELNGCSYAPGAAIATVTTVSPLTASLTACSPGYGVNLTLSLDSTQTATFGAFSYPAYSSGNGLINSRHASVVSTVNADIFGVAWTTPGSYFMAMNSVGDLGVLHDVVAGNALRGASATITGDVSSSTLHTSTANATTINSTNNNSVNETGTNSNYSTYTGTTFNGANGNFTNSNGTNSYFQHVTGTIDVTTPDLTVTHRGHLLFNGHSYQSGFDSTSGVDDNNALLHYDHGDITGILDGSGTVCVPVTLPSPGYAYVGSYSVSVTPTSVAGIGSNGSMRWAVGAKTTTSFTICGDRDPGATSPAYGTTVSADWIAVGSGVSGS